VKTIFFILFDLHVYNVLQRRAKRSSALRARAAELARADCKARKGGTKLRLATLFGHVLIRYPAKADYMYKVTKQFGLARRSGTFLLDAGVPPWRDGQTKVQL